MKRYLIISILMLPLVIIGQTPPTLPKIPAPPDISEVYRANPYFYEVMTGFPDNNSFYSYKFDVVKKMARHDPAMMVILGDHYRIGRSVEVDLQKALKEYHRAASRGYAMGNHRIAYMYAEGLGLPKDPKMILEFLKRSADGGYAPAQYDYALIYLNGKFDEPRDLKIAYPFLLKASAQGHRNATELLAMLSYHSLSAEAGIPTGLETALQYYRKAKDSDGERNLLQQMSSFGALRYYMRVIPHFLPGVILPADPTDPDQGLKMLQQLEGKKLLTGEANYKTYRDELAENILYKAYFKAQNSREAILRFLIYCDHNARQLSPNQGRFFEAASRDFRLSVHFSNTEELGLIFAEFDKYPVIFGEKELPIAADRVFVALYNKEITPDLREMATRYLKETAWISQYVSDKYRIQLAN
jgi:TPR repeat protein